MDSSLNEKKKFIRHVILNAPPGKLPDLVSNLKVLFGSTTIINNFFEEVVSNYNEKNYAMVPITEDDYVITCEQSKNENLYLNPQLKLLVTVNHLKRKVTATTSLQEVKHSLLLENYRHVCSEKLKEYVESHYTRWNEVQTLNYPTVNLKSKNGLNVKCSSSVYATEQEDKFNLFFIICCDRFYLKNFHSIYTLSLLLIVKNAKGTIDIILTYFEDANINFKTTVKFEEKVNVDNEIEAFSTNILSAIRACENNVLYDLNNFMINTSKSLIKNARKIIPLNGDKFYWKETYQNIPSHIRLIQ
ncbi:F-actin-capping protein subunit alpha, putative (CPalpha) [Plasmodium ovale wallikeri]|uniref:F-actin-capping protein subunit alpha n=1 Tax=Plasmodium ovale wallikeri TaxID=864142 RepID=A0A1A8YY55_PLAOA|nr:F-actin-capping protein subunit alpha, putative (CPalpha) [Plasmodium ovale wallikeri]SBT36391.1 F-actin-capping protein subunit alpha, putative (CPalpha) [Plasmodium ovale wallikeri]